MHTTGFIGRGTQTAPAAQATPVLEPELVPEKPEIQEIPQPQPPAPETVPDTQETAKEQKERSRNFLYQVRNNFLSVVDIVRREKLLVYLRNIESISVIGDANNPALHIFTVRPDGNNGNHITLTGDSLDQYDAITEAILDRMH